MARGRQLSQLLTQLQGETGMSMLPASSVTSREHRVQVLNRTQARLYAAFDWDFAFSWRDVRVEAGDRRFGQPADLDFERVNYCAIKTLGEGNNDWQELAYGINESSFIQIGEDVQGRPMRWAPAEEGKVELWPVPDAEYTVRLRGVLTLPLMVDSDDRAVLDDTLIVLFAASELLKRAKLPDWEDKAREAQLHFTRLRAQNGGNKRASFISGGAVSGLVGDYVPPLRRGIDYVD